MHTRTNRAQAGLAAVLFACLLAGPTSADPAAQTMTGDEAQKPAETGAGVTTGSVNAEESAQKRFADCMAIWEPRTHMTKSEWRRTCKTSLQELPSP